MNRAFYLLLSSLITMSSANLALAKDVQVKGYTKKDGTVVAPYTKHVKDKDSKGDAKADSKAETKADTKTEAKADAKADTKAETKTEAKSDSKDKDVVHVKGYTKKDGTKVAGYTRKKASKSK